MDFLTLLVLAIGLSMDALAVSICKGLCLTKLTVKNMLIVGVWFGGFQALMPTIGYFLGIQFSSLIETYAPWIAFVLLVLIGLNMIKESFDKVQCDETKCDILNHKKMFFMSVATSIDALAVGITFACVPVSILPSLTRTVNTLLGAVIIGITTFLLSMGGVKIGHVFGAKYKSKAEFTGGIILILLALKIILEHLFT